jgi:cobalamin biosynthesis protein CobW
LATNKIPVTVITGFLGAGKTSLIRHLVTHAGGRRLALLINEFGEMGVDGEILKACGDDTCGEDDIIELTNGCICCTVADDFLPTLTTLLDRDEQPDHIVIETSGLALPKPLVKAFQWPEVRSRTTVDSVISVVDGPAFQAGLFAEDPDAVQLQREADDMLDHDSPLAEVFEDQIACADLIVLSKSDLMSPASVEETRSKLGADASTGVQVVVTDHGVIDPSLILGLESAVEDVIDDRWSHHDGLDDHDHDDFDSFVVGIGAVDDPEKLAKRARDTLAIDGVLRIKGVASVTGKNARLVVQGVGSRLDHYYDRPWKSQEARDGQLVVIGLTGFDRARAEATLKG